jgi:hypothetical protein
VQPDESAIFVSYPKDVCDIKGSMPERSENFPLFDGFCVLHVIAHRLDSRAPSVN